MVINDVALVLQGGGTRAAYSAGVLDVLLEEKIYFPLVIGTSAGALLGVNYISQDKGRSALLLKEKIRDRKLLSPLNLLTKGSLYDFHYLFYVLPKCGLPFNQKMFRENHARFYAVATSITKGKTVLFSKESNDFWAGLAASCALPLFSKPIEARNDFYLDGGLLSSIPYQEALSLGATKIVCVLTREQGYRKKRPRKSAIALCKKMYNAYPMVDDLYVNSSSLYNKKMDELESMDKNRVFCLYPSIAPHVSVAERNRKKLANLVQLGKIDMQKQMNSLKEFLER